MKLKYIFLASALVLTSCTTPIKFTIKTHTSDAPSVTTTEEPTTTTTSVEPTSTDEPNTSTSTKEPTTTTSREDIVYSDDDDWGPLHD